MGKQTADFYNTHASVIFDRYESVQSNITNYFQSSFLAGSSLLDIGADSSRDLRKMLALGFDADGIEPCDELRRIALETYPELANHLSSGSLPNLQLVRPEKTRHFLW
jgi:hypothetical protein